MNLLFIGDLNYKNNIITCVASILRFPVDGGYNIYIMQNDWDDDGKNEMHQLVNGHGEVHFINVDTTFFGEFPTTKRYPEIIYYRILAAKFLPKKLERILYLDGDIIVINSLKELYEMEFDGNLFCACTHVKSFLTKINQLRLGANEESSYINSGVLLMNLKVMRERICEEEIIEFVEKRSPVLFLPDQDILSALYGDSIKLLDAMKYNLSDRLLNFYNVNLKNETIDIDWIRHNSVIIHYYGKNKPWREGYCGILNIFYNEVVENDVLIH